MSHTVARILVSASWPQGPALPVGNLMVAIPGRETGQSWVESADSSWLSFYPCSVASREDSTFESSNRLREPEMDLNAPDFVAKRHEATFDSECTDCNLLTIVIGSRHEY